MTLRVGVGTADITPPVPVVLAGFFEGPVATEVHDRLEVRALHLAEGDAAVCLLVCDLLGMSPRFAGPVRAAVAGALGLGLPAVLTACNHTHAGPGTMTGSPWPTPEGYLEQLVEACCDAAREARAGAVDASLRFARSPLPADLSLNRRGHPYDPTFALLDVVAATGDRLATLANVAIHPVALGPECVAVSPDWIGPFRRALEARAGGTAVLLSGALGDVNPRHVHRQENRCTADPFQEAEVLGRGVAEAVDGALGQADDVGGSRLGVERWRRVRVDPGDTRLGRSRRGKAVEVELIEWSLGPVRLVSVPGEAFHALGRRIEDRHGPRVLVAGLAPTWNGYLPEPFGDGYEEDMSLGSKAVSVIAAALTGD
jgi:hypothetical protein